MFDSITGLGKAAVTVPGLNGHESLTTESEAHPDVDSIGQSSLEAPEERTRSIQLGAVSPLLSPNEGMAYASEQYRILRTRICQLLKRPFQLVITSPTIGDGKTITAVNVATAMALRSNEQTLLIDADLRRSSIHRVLQVPNDCGLVDVLQGTRKLEDAVFRSEEVPCLHVLTAGTPPGNPAELLDSDAWRELARTARARFGQIIIDSPPVEVVADFDLIAGQCDGVALVLRPDHTNRTLTLQTIKKLKPKLTGVIINVYPEWFLWKRPSHQGYYYYKSRPDPAPAKRKATK